MILCIDTLTPKANVTLLIPGHSSVSTSFDPFSASEETLKGVESLLLQHEVTLKDLKKIALISGPGSFTGLRVGLSVANTLAQELDLEVLGLTTAQWWQGGIEQEDWIYVQSMNPAELYVVGFGLYKSQFGPLLEVKDFPTDLPWSGVLSVAHRELLKSDQELEVSNDVGKIWEKSLQMHHSQFKKGEAIEAFYLKQPKITAARN